MAAMHLVVDVRGMALDERLHAPHDAAHARRERHTGFRPSRKIDRPVGQAGLESQLRSSFDRFVRRVDGDARRTYADLPQRVSVTLLTAGVLGGGAQEPNE